MTALSASVTEYGSQPLLYLYGTLSAVKAVYHRCIAVRLVGVVIRAKQMRKEAESYTGHTGHTARNARSRSTVR